MALSNITEVKFIGGLTNEYTDSEILNEIASVEAILYKKYGLPKRSGFSIDSDYTDFYIFEDNVYEIIRVQVGVDTSVDPSGYLTVEESSTTWSYDSGNNFITLAPEFIALYENALVRVQHIPKTYNDITKNVAAYNLISVTAVVDQDGVTSPQLTVIKNRIDNYKMELKPKKISYSSKAESFDKYDYVSITQSNLR